MPSTRRTFRASAAQVTATTDLAGNLATCQRLAQEAADAGSDLLVIPECFAYIGKQLADRIAVAETIDAARPGPILAAVFDLATRHKMWVVAGGMPEIIAEDDGKDHAGKVWNTCVAVSPDGELAATYRKIHLFDLDIPGKASYLESDSTGAGRQVVTVETPLARLGLSICYDLRFPELYRALAVEHGAEVLLVPAAFTAHTGAAHWHVLLRARAIENQCYVIAAGQTGQHHPKRASYGHSLIIDPWGTILAELPTEVGLCTADIDLAALDRFREEMPCHSHKVL
jgi:predicted amidohydrolase